MNLKSIIHKNKKGDPTDVLVFVIVFFFLAIGFLTIIFLTSQISTGLEGTALGDHEDVSPHLEGLESFGPNVAGWGFLMLFAASLLGLVVSSFLIRQHPVFIIVYILMLIVTLVLAWLLSWAWDSIITFYPFDEAVQEAVLINLFMNNLVLIALAFGALSILIVFSKVFTSPGGS